MNDSGIVQTGLTSVQFHRHLHRFGAFIGWQIREQIFKVGFELMELILRKHWVRKNEIAFTSECFDLFR